MITIGCNQDTGRKLEIFIVVLNQCKKFASSVSAQKFKCPSSARSTRYLFSLARLSVAQLKLITTIYLQDLWGISANADILFEIFVTHYFTISRDHVFNGKFAMDVYCIWAWQKIAKV